MNIGARDIWLTTFKIYIFQSEIRHSLHGGMMGGIEISPWNQMEEHALTRFTFAVTISSFLLYSFSVMILNSLSIEKLIRDFLLVLFCPICNLTVLQQQ